MARFALSSDRGRGCGREQKAGVEHGKSLTPRGEKERRGRAVAGGPHLTANIQSILLAHLYLRNLVETFRTLLLSLMFALAYGFLRQSKSVHFPYLMKIFSLQYNGNISKQLHKTRVSHHRGMYYFISEPKDIKVTADTIFVYRSL